MLTNFRVGDRVEDEETHKRGCVTFVYSKLEFRGEFIEVPPGNGCHNKSARACRLNHMPD
jgi:hypothetical protein